MTRNLRRVVPHRDHVPTPRELALRDALGRRHYGDAYSSGTVRKTSKLLRAGVADLGDDELSDPDVAFYAAMNPGHHHGDGLLVLVPASFENLTAYLHRRLRKSFERRPRPRHSESAHRTGPHPPRDPPPEDSVPPWGGDGSEYPIPPH